MRQIILFITLVVAASQAAAGDGLRRVDSDAILGGAIGGGAGAAIGSAIGGRDGAIVGGALGAATGVALTTDRGRRTYVVRERWDDDYYHHDHGHHYGHYKHRHHHDD